MRALERALLLFMDESIVLRYWKCFAPCEKALARAMASEWNGFSASLPRVVMFAVALTYASGEAELRLDAFVHNFGLTYATVEVDGVDVEFVTGVTPWLGEVAACADDGGCTIGAPECVWWDGVPPS